MKEEPFMDFLKLSQSRYSCRKMSDKPVEQEKIDRIIAAAIAAPTAKNNQPYKLWLFKSEEAMAKLKETTHFTFGAKIVLAVGVKKSDAFIRPFDQKNYGEIDGAIIATHIMLAIEAEGLASTWVGYFDAPKLQELFPQMKEFEMIALFPIGYAAEDAKPSPRHTERRAVEDVLEVL